MPTNILYLESESDALQAQSHLPHTQKPRISAETVSSKILAKKSPADRSFVYLATPSVDALTDTDDGIRKIPWSGVHLPNFGSMDVIYAVNDPELLELASERFPHAQLNLWLLNGFDDAELSRAEEACSKTGANMMIEFAPSHSGNSNRSIEKADTYPIAS